MTTTPLPDWLIARDIEIVASDSVTPHPDNPNEGDVGAIVESIEEVGFYEPILVQESSRRIISGEHRWRALTAMGRPEVPVTFIDVDDETALRILIGANEIARRGSRVDEQRLAKLLTDLAQQTDTLAGTGFDMDALDSLLADLAMPDVPVIDKNLKVNPRTSAVDLIYSLYPGHPWSYLAKYSGWLLGAMSALAVFNADNVEWWSRRQTVSFIDNAWHDYDHAKHADVIARIRPKYATVRDALTQSQAQTAGVEWYSLPQIIDWADEVDESAEHTIVIPKYDCIDDIPDRFMLGYSLPSSYGRTELPFEAFAGRRVHLLGGSWTHQRAALAVLGDDVKSLDNNWIGRIAKFGQFAMPDGSRMSIGRDLNLTIVNPQIACIVLSLGNIARAAHEMFPAQMAPADLDEPDQAILEGNLRDAGGDE